MSAGKTPLLYSKRISDAQVVNAFMYNITAYRGTFNSIDNCKDYLELLNKKKEILNFCNDASLKIILRDIGEITQSYNKIKLPERFQFLKETYSAIRLIPSSTGSDIDKQKESLKKEIIQYVSDHQQVRVHGGSSSSSSVDGGKTRQANIPSGRSESDNTSADKRSVPSNNETDAYFGRKRANAFISNIRPTLTIDTNPSDTNPSDTNPSDTNPSDVAKEKMSRVFTQLITPRQTPLRHVLEDEKNKFAKSL